MCGWGRGEEEESEFPDPGCKRRGCKYAAGSQLGIAGLIPTPATSSPSSWVTPLFPASAPPGMNHPESVKCSSKKNLLLSPPQAPPLPLWLVSQSCRRCKVGHGDWGHVSTTTWPWRLSIVQAVAKVERRSTGLVLVAWRRLRSHPKGFGGVQTMFFTGEMKKCFLELAADLMASQTSVFYMGCN